MNIQILVEKQSKLLNAIGIKNEVFVSGFLNGVCRHERSRVKPAPAILFLNGVCRHEQVGCTDLETPLFLNGVCRHERYYTG